jgi:hypothetical protein
MQNDKIEKKIIRNQGKKFESIHVNSTNSSHMT